MINLVQQLVLARETKKYSQTTLAEESGLSRMTIVRTELEQIDPRLSTILLMARSLGLDVVLVPKELKQSLEQFIQSGGKYVGQAPGVDAPLSIIDTLLGKGPG